MSKNETERDRLANQLVKLGDMMGDGLHHESDGKWINREYRKVLKALEPEIFAKQRAKKRDRVNEQISKLILSKKCSCGGTLRQSRYGSVILYCNVCETRYKATSKPQKK